MRLIPNTPNSDSTGSERLVMRLLRAVDWRWGVALSSLNLAEHEHQRWGEIDFVLVGEPGLLVIEVKGGIASCEQGIWSYTDRNGRVVRRKKSPMLQAKEAYHSLIRNYVDVRFGQRFLDGVPTGFCTILAGTPRASVRHLLGSPEFPPELWGTEENVRDQGRLAQFLGTAIRHWGARPNLGRPRLLDQSGVDELVSFLRPEFERVPSLNIGLQNVRTEQLQLTNGQYRTLDYWEGAARTFVTGPAGCGKTFLAAELARRVAASGEEVLFLTGTSHLAAYLRTVLQAPKIRIRSYDDLQRQPETPADFLVIDEGQVLLSKDALTQIDLAVRGGISAGRWTWFGDPSFQGRDKTVDPDVLLTLRNHASVMPRISENCRNTPQIVTATEMASGVPLGHVQVVGQGPEPSWAYVEGAFQGAVEGASRIREWLDREVPLSDVVLLVNGSECDALAEAVASQLSARAFRWSAGTSPSGTVLRWSTIDDFRGLESAFVVVILAEAIESPVELQRLLYLAMSRANLGLAVVVNERDQASIQEAYRRKLADAIIAHQSSALK
jgi:hypothetical protein